MINWMSTGNYLVVHYGSSRPCIIEKGTDKYSSVLALLTNSAQEEEVIKALDIGSQLESYSEGNFTIDQSTGLVKIDGEEIHNVLAERIVEFCKQNLPYLPLVNFVRNVRLNPSNESKEHLYLFLEANKMPITHDGCFLAYKKVKSNSNGDLVDCYTGTFCNNVGAVVTMDRDRVNPDRHQTCSHGLHVAAFGYMSSYEGTAIIEVKVNPKDVIAVPSDYNNQKMRVCRYEVVAINFQHKPIEKVLLEKTDIRAKRKLGEKTIKTQKSNVKKEKRDEHLALIASLKETKPGEEVLLGGLTAPEIVDVVKTLTDQDIMVGLKDMKNKKGIVKRAKDTLTEKGFTVN